MVRRSSLVAALALTASSLAWGDRFDFAVSAAAGYDGNPLLVMDDGPGGAFTQVALEAGAHHAFDRGLALFATGSARARRYEQSVQNADTENARVRLGFGWVPEWAGRRFAIAAGAKGGMARSTFVDRATGQIYTVDVETIDTTTPVPVGRRFDSLDSGVFADLRFSQNRRVRWSLDASWERTTYTEDYSHLEGLEELDHDLLSIEPGVAIVLDERVNLAVSLQLSDLDYAERPALDVAGAEAADTAREYRHSQLEATLRLQPGPRWNLSFGLGGGGRDDTYAGFYDYRAWSSFVTAERTLNERARLRFYGSWRSLDYERAPSPDDPEALRATDARTALVRYEQGIAPRIRWFADLGTQSARSTDQTFTYDQEWLLTGIEYRR